MKLSFVMYEALAEYICHFKLFSAKLTIFLFILQSANDSVSETVDGIENLDLKDDKVDRFRCPVSDDEVAEKSMKR